MDSFLETSVVLSRPYRERFIDANWKMCGQIEESPWDALKFFLFGYAFERQGRSPDYAVAAHDVVDEVKEGRRVDAELAQSMWRRFSEKLKNGSLNHANNPLCPQGSKYSRRYNGEARPAVVAKRSAIQLVGEVMDGESIVSWARDRIANDQIVEAHREICRINGISNKIASLFLRDVATMFDLKPRDDRPFLQPIDTWVRLVARTIAKRDDLGDAACAQYLVTASEDPELANQGVWYLCTQVAWSSKYWVRRCLEDQTWLSGLVEKHFTRLAQDAQVASSFLAGMEQ